MYHENPCDKWLSESERGVEYRKCAKLYGVAPHIVKKDREVLINESDMVNEWELRFYDCRL